MNLENELLEKFQVEELEKRYEMGFWTPTKNEDGSTTFGDNGGNDLNPPPSEPKNNVDPFGPDGNIHFVTPEEKAGG